MPGFYPSFGAPPPPASTHGLEAVKICGITSADDAKLVTNLAPVFLPTQTDLYLGMILWPGSRRSIKHDTAREIASIANDAGVTPVGVFVDESVDEMLDICEKCKIKVCQLHGPACRASWEVSSPTMPNSPLSWIDVRDVHGDASISKATAGSSPPLWTIFDAKGGGTGKPFDWNQFERPCGNDGKWLLAGGLNPDNISEAVETLRPMGLDVAGGVAGPDKCKKDEHRLKLFLQRAVSAYS